MDRTSKIIFALIAVGLWFNAAANLLRPAYAQQDVLLTDISHSAQSIASSLVTLVTGTGNCTNQQLCSR